MPLLRHPSAQNHNQMYRRQTTDAIVASGSGLHLNISAASFIKPRLAWVYSIPSGVTARKPCCAYPVPSSANHAANRALQSGIRVDQNAIHVGLTDFDGREAIDVGCKAGLGRGEVLDGVERCIRQAGPDTLHTRVQHDLQRAWIDSKSLRVISGMSKFSKSIIRKITALTMSPSKVSGMERSTGYTRSESSAKQLRRDEVQAGNAG